MVAVSNDPFVSVLTKLGLAHLVPTVLDKAKEISDRISLKAFHASSHQTQTTVICIEIACELLNIPFDSDSAIKTLSFKKLDYNKSKKTFLKLINLNKVLDVNGLLLKLGVCNHNVEKSAKEFLARCLENNEMSDHPQFVALSCYLACKLHKEKVLKKHFVAASNLRPVQWTQLEKSYEKLVHQPSENRKKPEEEDSLKGSEHQEKLKRKRNKEPEVEDYDVWKKRVLKAAHEAIEAGK